MKNSTVSQEKISALADGELQPNELDAVLASLREPKARSEWDIYHQVGDVLRSDDMAVDLSPDFAASMKAKLDAEPVIFAPSVLPAKTLDVQPQGRNQVRRYAMPGIAAALAVFTAYLVAPQLDTDGSAPVAAAASVAVASTSMPAPASAKSAPVLTASAAESASVATDVSQEAVVLRDPNIDEYLIAHQRYSPSLYDTSQFVRSATFETEPQK